MTRKPAPARPFTLPVGQTTWDPHAPAWLDDGTLHVGNRRLELGPRVGQFVLGATGVYWMRDETLMFTSAEGEQEQVAEVIWTNLATSADRTVVATVDQSRGPTDRYGAHVMQVAAFDTRTGEQLYRTPDRDPDDRADLGATYSEVMPLLDGVSGERLFFAGRTIDLQDGSSVPTKTTSEGDSVYRGLGQTLFPDGYHVGLRGEGPRREVTDTEVFGVGRLSPDRSTIFDVSQWPTTAVVYDARTRRQAALDAPWNHFRLAGWSDKDTFFGVAERIDPRSQVNILRARRVVTCELRSLRCTPVSPVIPADDTGHRSFLLEGSSQNY